MSDLDQAHAAPEAGWWYVEVPLLFHARTASTTCRAMAGEHGPMCGRPAAYAGALAGGVLDSEVITAACTDHALLLRSFPHLLRIWSLPAIRPIHPQEDPDDRTHRPRPHQRPQHLPRRRRVTDV